MTIESQYRIIVENNHQMMLECIKESEFRDVIIDAMNCVNNHYQKKYQKALKNLIEWKLIFEQIVSLNEYMENINNLFNNFLDLCVVNEIEKTKYIMKN